MPANDQDFDLAIPDDLADAMRRAAAAVPSADLHHTGPRLRLQARQRRRRAGVALAAVAAAATTVVAVNLLPSDGDRVVVGEEPTVPTDGPAASTTTPPRSSAGADAPLLLENVWVEWLPDGTVRELPRAQPDDAPSDAVRLADGRLVTLASRDLDPGVAREDGAFVEGLAFVMAVFDPQGNLLGEKDIRQVGSNVDLLGESDGGVVLRRSRAAGDCCRTLPGVGLSVIDPATFAERPLATVEGALGPADLRGHRLVVAGDSFQAADGGAAGCWVDVVDLPSEPGERFALPDCIGTRGVAVSPDGSRAAITVDGLPRDAGVELALLVVDLDSGDVVLRQALDEVRCDTDELVCGKTEFRSITWADDATVNVVVQDPDARPDDVVTDGRLVAERLRVVTVDTVSGDSGDSGG